MAEYIERTEELILAVNAGARVIENTKRYHGASYCIDVFAADQKEIPYLKAAEVLRGFDEIPAADVAPVVRCRDCKHFSRFQNTNWCEVFDDGYYNPDDNDFCSRGTKDGEG